MEGEAAVSDANLETLGNKGRAFAEAVGDCRNVLRHAHRVVGDERELRGGDRDGRADRERDDRRVGQDGCRDQDATKLIRHGRA